MKSLIAGIGLAGCVCFGWFLVASQMTRASASPRAIAGPLYHDPYDPARKSQDVAFHEERVKRDPQGAIGWSMLSGAYLARSRESDSYSDAVKAEKAARKSLELRTKGNLGGQTRLINSLLQQHRFQDALAVDEQALNLWGPDPQLTQLHADIFLEVGRYDDAQRVIDGNSSAFGNPTGKSVIARLALLQGNGLQALDLLRAAYAEVDSNSAATAENVAWFEEKIGECLMSIGQVGEAEKAFQKTLDLYPRDYKAYANLTRLAASRGDWTSVIAFGHKSNAIAPMADILALVGDAYSQQGRQVLAEAEYAKVVALAGKPGGPSDGLHEFAGASGGHGHTLDRQYAMFCADHNRDLDGAYACALRELQARRDVYAFDVLAWVCLKRGDRTEALQAIRKALSERTEDARILFHAGIIAQANGFQAEADGYLARARSLPGTLTSIERRAL